MSNAARQELHALVDALPASEEQAARRYEVLRDASDPYASLDNVEPLLDLAAAGKSVAAEDLVRELRAARWNQNRGASRVRVEDAF